MQLYFIRHAQSENNALYERTGSDRGRSCDPELTAAGRRQAELLAEFIAQAGAGAAPGVYDPRNSAGFGLTHIYTSLMVRAAGTAQRLASAVDLPLVAWEDLHEEGGIFLEDETSGERHGQPGKNRAYFQEHFPGLVLPEKLDEKGWWNRPFEAYEARRPRARAVLSELLHRHLDRADRVALVSHGGFGNHLLSALFSPIESGNGRAPDFPQLPAYRWFLMNNTAITRIDFAEHEVRLVYLNRTDFLSPDLVT